VVAWETAFITKGMVLRKGWEGREGKKLGYGDRSRVLCRGRVSLCDGKIPLVVNWEFFQKRAGDRLKKSERVGGQEERYVG